MNLRKIFLISFSLIALEATINNNEIKAATTGTIVGGDFFYTRFMDGQTTGDIGRGVFFFDKVDGSGNVIFKDLFDNGISIPPPKPSGILSIFNGGKSLVSNPPQVRWDWGEFGLDQGDFSCNLSNGLGTSTRLGGLFVISECMADHIDILHEMELNESPELWQTLDPPIPVNPNLDPNIIAQITNLYQGTSANNFTNFDIDNNQITIQPNILNLPSPESNELLQMTGFTEINLVHLDPLNTNTGIELATLNVNEINKFTFDLGLFDSVDGFDPWLLSYTIKNPDTGQQIRFYDDKKIPEPSSVFSIFTLGILGVSSTLKRKFKSSKSTKKEDMGDRSNVTKTYVKTI